MKRRNLVFVLMALSIVILPAISIAASDVAGNVGFLETIVAFLKEYTWAKVLLCSALTMFPPTLPLGIATAVALS